MKFRLIGAALLSLFIVLGLIYFMKFLSEPSFDLREDKAANFEIRSHGGEPEGEITWKTEPGTVCVLRPTETVWPQYPKQFSRSRVGREGKVLVEFDILENGRTADIRIIEASHPAFGQSVLKAVAQWKFAPRNPSKSFEPCQPPIENYRILIEFTIAED